VTHPIQQLLGLTEAETGQLTGAMVETATAAYWAAIEQAIGDAMIEARIWNGDDETAAEARDFIRGQIGLEAVGDGRVRVLLFGQHAAMVHPPKAVAIPRPAEERRLVC
jgi:hypothetical protein